MVAKASQARTRVVFRWQEYLLDLVAWSVAVPVAAMLRLELDITTVSLTSVASTVILAAIMQAGFGWVLALYRYRHPYGSRHDAQTVLMVVVSIGLVLTCVRFLAPASEDFPRSVPLIASLIAFVFMAGLRLLHRIFLEREFRPGEEATPTLIYGAGHMGQYVVQLMNRDRYSPYRPAGLIDDDPKKSGFRFHGVPVLGSSEELTEAAKATGAEVLILAVARADADLLRVVSDLADAAGLRLLILPVLSDVLEGKARLGDLRDVSIEDLIGRHPVDTQVESIASFVTDKRVLVTGAGGSIGSELCRQLLRFSPMELIMLDRDETGLQGVQISISGHGLLDSNEVVLADIRDAETLEQIFLDRSPDVVFHAAALKHLPMLEQYPHEAWQTNVLGTVNVLNAARAAGVQTFVNVSTDKAANPISVLGFSKRLGERLTAWYAMATGHTYLSVRFGNVIGSRGSMLPTFQSQIEAGGPLTVTHPEVTRYFMTIPEACQLVIQAGAIGRPGEVLILDMGEPVRILDVAERMVARSGRDVKIVFTGLRHGEKLHEELVGSGEGDERPMHPKISHTEVPALSPEELSDEEWGFSVTEEVKGMKHAIGRGHVL